MNPWILAIALPASGLQISFPQGAVATEQIALRWMHFVAGIIWIGLLYFFNLVGTPTLKGIAMRESSWARSGESASESSCTEVS